MSPTLPASGRKPGQLLRAVLVAHGIVTLAAAVVLAVFPAAIPATVGIELSREGFLLSYFLAAAELAIGVLSIGAVRVTDRRALTLILDVFILFHLATAGLEVIYLGLTGMDTVIVVNVVIRVAVSAAFVFARRAVGRVGGD